MIESINCEFKEHHSEEKEAVSQIEFAFCFAPRVLVSFIHHSIELSIVYQFSKTGRGQIVTRFSYINLILNSFAERGTKMILEHNIVSVV